MAVEEGDEGSFVVFRLLTIGWMLRWVLSQRGVLPGVYFALGSGGLLAMIVVNLCLFYRLLVADHFLKPASASKNVALPPSPQFTAQQHRPSVQEALTSATATSEESSQRKAD